MIVARDRFEPTFNPDDFSTHSSAIIKADFGSHIVYGAYLPTGARKFAHFDYLIEAARIHNAQGDRAVAIGDFNAGQNEIDIQINATSGKMRDEFPAHSRFLALNELWPEAWRRLHPRAREYSWYASNKPISQKQGWRLDHAFVSQAMLPNLRKAAYLPETRQLDLTDHSALVVEFDNLV